MVATEDQQAVYLFIAQRIRERRKQLHLSQSKLAELMGFSYQQMQKYETGASRVSAARLLGFAQVMNVPPSYFYEGVRLDGIARNTHYLIGGPRTTPLRILLVEDAPTDAVAFDKALARSACPTSIHLISHSGDVMDYLAHHQTKYGHEAPDLIIIGLSAAKMREGLTLLHSIKHSAATQTCPVLMLSSSIHMQDLIDSYREGASGFIQKSVDADEYAKSLDIAMQYWARAVALPIHTEAA